MRYLDLTHTLDALAPTWNGSCGYHIDVKMTHAQGCLVHQVKMHAGIGTHMDAPLHFYKEGLDIASIPVEALMGTLVCIHAIEPRTENFVLTKDHIALWEKKFGKIPEGSFVLIHSGWDQRWGQDSYRNVQKDHTMLFPSVSKEAAEELLERKIKGLGVDTLSPDLPNSGFPVHHLLLAQGIIILENLTRLDMVPATGAKFLALPPKWRGASEAPVRALAFLGFTDDCAE